MEGLIWDNNPNPYTSTQGDADLNVMFPTEIYTMKPACWVTYNTLFIYDTPV